MDFRLTGGLPCLYYPGTPWYARLTAGEGAAVGSAVGGRVGELVGTGVGCTKKGALGCKSIGRRV